MSTGGEGHKDLVILATWKTKSRSRRRVSCVGSACERFLLCRTAQRQVLALESLNWTVEEVAAPAAPVATFQASKPATIPGMEEAGKPKSRPKKDKKGLKLPAVEIPKIDDTPFVPPAIIRERER